MAQYNIKSDVLIQENLEVAGYSDISGALDVGGIFTADTNAVIGGTLNVTGATSLNSTLAVTGNVSLLTGATLTVTDAATTLGGTLTVVGTANMQSGLSMLAADGITYNNITNLADGVNPNDAVNVSQLTKGGITATQAGSGLYFNPGTNSGDHYLGIQMTGTTSDPLDNPVIGNSDTSWASAGITFREAADGQATSRTLELDSTVVRTSANSLNEVQTISSELALTGANIDIGSTNTGSSVSIVTEDVQLTGNASFNIDAPDLVINADSVDNNVSGTYDITTTSGSVNVDTQVLSLAGSVSSTVTTPTYTLDASTVATVNTPVFNLNASNIINLDSVNATSITGSDINITSDVNSVTIGSAANITSSSINQTHTTTGTYEIDSTDAIVIDSDASTTIGGAGIVLASDGTTNDIDVTSAHDINLVTTGTGVLTTTVSGTDISKQTFAGQYAVDAASVLMRNTSTGGDFVIRSARDVVIDGDATHDTTGLIANVNNEVILETTADASAIDLIAGGAGSSIEITAESTTGAVSTIDLLGGSNVATSAITLGDNLSISSDGTTGISSTGNVTITAPTTEITNDVTIGGSTTLGNSRSSAPGDLLNVDVDTVSMIATVGGVQIGDGTSDTSLTVTGNVDVSGNTVLGNDNSVDTLDIVATTSIDGNVTFTNNNGGTTVQWADVPVNDADLTNKLYVDSVALAGTSVGAGLGYDDSEGAGAHFIFANLTGAGGLQYSDGTTTATNSNKTSTLELAIDKLASAGSVQGGDLIAIHDQSVGGTRYVTRDEFLGGLSGQPINRGTVQLNDASSGDVNQGLWGWTNDPLQPVIASLTTPPTGFLGHLVASIIDPDTSAGEISVISITNEGTGTATDGTYTGISVSGGAGSGATVDVLIESGEITSITVNNAGANYVAGDVVVVPVTGGISGIELTITSLVGSGPDRDPSDDASVPYFYTVVNAPVEGVVTNITSAGTETFYSGDTLVWSAIGGTWYRIPGTSGVQSFSSYDALSPRSGVIQATLNDYHDGLIEFDFDGSFDNKDITTPVGGSVNSALQDLDNLKQSRNDTFGVTSDFDISNDDGVSWVTDSELTRPLLSGDTIGKFDIRLNNKLGTGGSTSPNTSGSYTKASFTVSDEGLVTAISENTPYVHSGWNNTTDWSDNAGEEWVIVIAATSHGKGTNPQYRVEETGTGGFYNEVFTDTKINASGDIRIAVGLNSRFDGRIIVE